MKRRPDASLLVSIVVHVIVGAFALHAIFAPRHLEIIFGPRRSTPDATERVRFVTTPLAPEAAVPSRTRIAREARAPAAPPRLVAPIEVPQGIPVPTVAPPTVVDSGRGTVGAIADPASRSVSVAPVFTDPRIFDPPPSGYIPPAKTQAEELASRLARAIKEYRDSVTAANANRRDPTDWTMERNGQKYGIDTKWIHLGKFQIPTALLALIPVNIQGNPTVMARERRLNEMSAEINERAGVELEARDEIKRINARVDRERAARLRAKAAATPPPGGQ